jgi:pilus assembly protein CpaE
MTIIATTPVSTAQKLIAVGTPQTFRQQIGRALEIDPELIEWMPTVTAAESFLADHTTGTGLIVLSPGVKDQDAVGFAEFVMATSPATAVVLVRDRHPDGVVPIAMRAGIRDVVDLTKGGDELKDALARALSWSRSLRSQHPEAAPQAAGHHGRVVSVFSSKGGTGKTFLSVNLAVALARTSGQDVALVDMALELGDTFSYFGAEAKRPLQDLLAVGDITDREEIMAVATQLVPGVWAYASPPGHGNDAASGEAIGKMLRSFRSAFSYVVVDASAGFSDASLATFDISDTICLISGLDIVGIRHLGLSLETLMSLGFPRERFRVVMNRADSKVGLDPAEVARVMNLTVDAMIPSSRLVPTSLNHGKPVSLEEPRSAVAKSIDNLAETLIAEFDGTGGSAKTTPTKKRRLF